MNLLNVVYPYATVGITLQCSHIPLLTEVLADCTHKWEEIGMALGLSKSIIEDSRHGTSNLIRLHNILNSWYQIKDAQLTLSQRYSTNQVKLKYPMVNPHSLGYINHIVSQQHINGRRKDSIYPII